MREEFVKSWWDFERLDRELGAKVAEFLLDRLAVQLRDEGVRCNGPERGSTYAVNSAAAVATAEVVPAFYLSLVDTVLCGGELWRESRRRRTD